MMEHWLSRSLSIAINTTSLQYVKAKGIQFEIFVGGNDAWDHEPNAIVFLLVWKIFCWPIHSSHGYGKQIIIMLS